MVAFLDGTTIFKVKKGTYFGELELPIATPTSILYEFDGWYTSNGVKLNEDKQLNYNQVIIAKFKEKSASPTSWFTYKGDTITGFSDEYLSMTDPPMDLVLPSSAGGQILTTVGQKAFRNRNLLTSIVLPESINLVDINAFEGCTSLNLYLKGQKLDTQQWNGWSDIGNIKAIHFDSFFQISSKCLAGIMALKNVEFYCKGKLIKNLSDCVVRYRSGTNSGSTGGDVMLFDGAWNPIHNSGWNIIFYTSGTNYSPRHLYINNDSDSSVFLIPAYVGDEKVSDICTYLYSHQHLKTLVYPRYTDLVNGVEMSGVRQWCGVETIVIPKDVTKIYLPPDKNAVSGRSIIANAELPALKNILYEGDRGDLKICNNKGKEIGDFLYNDLDKKINVTFNADVSEYYNFLNP